ncbi:G-PROTEIN-RECEP-F1-2 domain-containing protein [Aphelenchoides fujianensis]|nr:G-PROTEIN-RECEP-F1-2 domain-containing protein [Aphelenchoides fujianensis]
MFLDSSQLSAESLARTAVIVGVLVLLLFSSITSIIIILANRNLNDVTGYYLISLATADLLWAVFIVPLSVYSSLVPDWNFMGDDSLLCKSSAYLQIVILTSTLFTFGWISVDRYSAFTKPSRYESEHTLTRCKCWIAFSWLTAVLAALPVIVAKMEANYYQEYEFCVLNWSSAAAYSITLSVLVLVPSLCTIVFTTGAIISAIRKPAELEDIQRTALQTDQNFFVTLFVVIAFFLAWLPIVVVHFIPSALMHPADKANMKFAFVWLAIGGSSSKWLIHMFINREFRRSFCIPCIGREVDASDDLDEPAPPPRKSCVTICCFCLPKPPPRPVRHAVRSLPNANSYLQFPSEPVPRASFGNFNGGTHLAMTEPFFGARGYNEYGTIARMPSVM